MDVDGSSMTPQGGEVDQNLLRLFSCMNTTDREELVSQVQRVLGPDINDNTARFFLDMCNWNLQDAVCLYLDYNIIPRFPSMSVVAVKSHEAPILPGSSFEHSWTITNTGSDTWPGSCQIVHACGKIMSMNSTTYVANLPPGHTTTVHVHLVAPDTVGQHWGHFHLTTDRGEKFGDILLVEITTESPETQTLTHQMALMCMPNNQMGSNVQANNQGQQSEDQMC